MDRYIWTIPWFINSRDKKETRCVAARRHLIIPSYYFLLLLIFASNFIHDSYMMHGPTFQERAKFMGAWGGAEVQKLRAP